MFYNEREKKVFKTVVIQVHTTATGVLLMCLFLLEHYNKKEEKEMRFCTIKCVIVLLLFMLLLLRKIMGHIVVLHCECYCNRRKEVTYDAVKKYIIGKITKAKFP